MDDVPATILVENQVQTKEGSYQCECTKICGIVLVKVEKVMVMEV